MLNVVAWEREDGGRVGGVANYPELGDFAPKELLFCQAIRYGSVSGDQKLLRQLGKRSWRRKRFISDPASRSSFYERLISAN